MDRLRLWHGAALLTAGVGTMYLAAWCSALAYHAGYTFVANGSPVYQQALGRFCDFIGLPLLMIGVLLTFGGVIAVAARCGRRVFTP